MKKIWLHIAGILCAMAVLAACTDDEVLSPQQEEGRPVDAVFRVHISMADGFGSRADSPHPDAGTAGHGLESRINSLQIFAVPLPDEGTEEDWSNVSWSSATVIQGDDDIYEVPLQLKGSGRMNIYIGANLSHGQASGLVESRGYTTRREKYYQAINEFAPFITNDAPETNRNPKDITMFCVSPALLDTKDKEQAQSGGNEGDEKPRYNIGTVSLKRLVAKVLVTCHLEDNALSFGGEEGVGYVPVTGDLVSGKDGPQCWIRQDEVYYFVNNMPRRMEFIQHYADDGGGGMVLQPNYNLKTVMTNLDTKFSPLKFDEGKVKQHFIHYDMLELYKRNKSFQPSSVWTQENYDDLISNDVSPNNPYNREGTGMYTLENMFLLKTEGDEAFTQTELEQMWAYDALPVITHVSIAARLTPRYLFVTTDEWNKMKEEDTGLVKEVETVRENIPGVKDGVTYVYLKCKSEKVSQEILTKSLEQGGALIEGNGDYDPDVSDNKYPEETFFAYNMADGDERRTMFCTYGVAVSFGTVGQVDASMVPYTRGWGYYYTYINNNESKPITTAEQLADACVERNCYYILSIKSIGSMGASVTDPNYMRVHTMKAPWKDGGKGEITLQ